MFIQFGYVVLFSSAFPLAAMCALINNIIEIRSDALKLCTGLQRPFGQRVENIGKWQVREGPRSGKMSERPLGVSAVQPIRGDCTHARCLCLSCPDCDGGHGSDCHHCQLLPDWSVWAAAAPLSLAESWDDHHLHCLTGGVYDPWRVPGFQALKRLLLQNWDSTHILPESTQGLVTF